MLSHCYLSWDLSKLPSSSFLWSGIPLDLSTCSSHWLSRPKVIPFIPYFYQRCYMRHGFGFVRPSLPAWGNRPGLLKQNLRLSKTPKHVPVAEALKHPKSGGLLFLILILQWETEAWRFLKMSEVRDSLVVMGFSSSQCRRPGLILSQELDPMYCS